MDSSQTTDRMSLTSPSSCHPLKGKRIRNRSFGGIIRYYDLTSYRYVLVKGRYTGIWSFPKGHSYTTETPLGCAKREILEETGIQLTEEPLRRERLKGGVYFVFHLNGKPENCETNDTFEVEEVRWVTLEEMRELKVNAGIKEFIERDCKRRC